MDTSTPIGIVIGIAALLTGFLMEEGTVGSLLQLSAFFIVMGGTAGAIIASYPFSELRKIPQWLKIAFNSKGIDLNQDVKQLIDSAERARREGLLSLEQELSQISDSFMQQGMQLVIDGTDPETTGEILDSSINAMTARHHVGISVFEAAGGFAPTLGIIGTVMGLIQVLGNLSDPSALSSSIAAAFTATLYGVASANLIFLPIATKLKLKDKQEVLRLEMIQEGILSIQAGENPSILREKLKTYVDNTKKEDNESFAPQTSSVEG